MVSHKLDIILGIVFEGKAKIMCEKLGFSQSNLSRWRSGKPMTTDELQKFFDGGFSLNWLFDVKDTDYSNMFNNTPLGIGYGVFETRVHKSRSKRVA